jgi:hypothetical protein
MAPHQLPAVLTATAASVGKPELASVIAIGGLLCPTAWIAWRFGPTITRYCGLASWWAGWACGSQGSYTYMIVLIALGTISWSLGTIWYHARRGRWPSQLSQRLFTRTPRKHERARSQQHRPKGVSEDPCTQEL